MYTSHELKSDMLKKVFKKSLEESKNVSPQA